MRNYCVQCIVFRRVPKIAKRDYQLRYVCRSVCPSLCLSTWNNLAPTQENVMQVKNNNY